MPVAGVAYRARLELAEKAQQTLDVQYYVLSQDDTGKRFMRALRDAARVGHVEFGDQARCFGGRISSRRRRVSNRCFPTSDCSATFTGSTSSSSPAAPRSSQRALLGPAHARSALI